MAEAVKEAERRLRVKEVVGATGPQRPRLEKKVSWWSIRSGGGHRMMTSEENGGGERVARVVRQPQQGASIIWESVIDRIVKWSGEICYHFVLASCCDQSMLFCQHPQTCIGGSCTTQRAVKHVVRGPPWSMSLPAVTHPCRSSHDDTTKFWLCRGNTKAVPD